MASINPYLNFNGTTEQVFNFYKSIFGGEFLMIQRFNEVPSDVENPATEEEGNRIMHIALPIGKSILMGSDTPVSFPAPIAGSNFSISVEPDSEAHAKQIFDGLAEGGKITMPLEKAFWGAYFGMCTDKFGINWMVNYQVE